MAGTCRPPQLLPRKSHPRKVRNSSRTAPIHQLRPWRPLMSASFRSRIVKPTCRRLALGASLPLLAGTAFCSLSRQAPMKQADSTRFLVSFPSSACRPWDIGTPTALAASIEQPHPPNSQFASSNCPKRCCGSQVPGRRGREGTTEIVILSKLSPGYGDPCPPRVIACITLPGSVEPARRFPPSRVGKLERRRAETSSALPSKRTRLAPSQGQPGSFIL